MDPLNLEENESGSTPETSSTKNEYDITNDDKYTIYAFGKPEELASKMCLSEYCPRF